MNAAVTTIVVVVAVIDIALGALVLQRNSRSATNRLFAASAAAGAAWIVANYLSDNLPASDTLLLFLNRLTVALGSIMGIFMLAFAITFPSVRSRFTLKWGLALAPLAILAVLTLTTPLSVAAITVETWGTNVVMGPLYPFAIVWAAILMLAGAVSIFKRYQVAGPRERIQFRYLYAGLFAFFFGAIAITGVVPFVTGSTEVARLTPVAMLFFLVPTAYAMLRHRLLDIGVASLRGVVATLLLAGLAAAIVVIAGEWIDRSLVPLGVQTEAGLFLVGFVVLLGFGPMRTALDRALDRVLRQRTYDPDQLLRRLGDVITTTLDPEAVALIVTEELAQEMKLSFASVLFYVESRPLTVSAGSEIPAGDLHRLLDLPHGDDTLVTDELESDDPRAASLTDARARVVIPLSHDGRRIGALVLGEMLSGRLYAARDLGFLEVLATETAAALRNASLFDELNQRVRELSALNQLAGVLEADDEIEDTMGAALAQAVEVTGAERGSIMLLDQTRIALKLVASVGLDPSVEHSVTEPLGEGIAGWVAATREPLLLVDRNDERFAAVALRDEISSAIAIPVVFKGELFGVINLSRVDNTEPFTDEALNVVVSFAGQLAVAIKNSRLYTDLENTFLGTISSLAAAVDAKDPYTYGHSTEVTEYADEIGSELRLSEHERHTLHIAATLHDIGKIGIDSATLRKPGRLTDEERAAMERHPSIGADILAPLDFLADAVPLILFHHERFSGGGYPTGISGSAIPLGARIISVADAYNAMVSDRPYRKGLPLSVARQELVDHAGTQFDPMVVAAFLPIIDGRSDGEPQLRVVPPPPLGPTPIRKSHTG